ncbi:MAG: hypothetical protein ACOCUT_00175 [bacterium]
MGWLVAKTFYGDTELSRLQKENAIFIIIMGPYFFYGIIGLCFMLIMAILSIGIIKFIVVIMIVIFTLIVLFYIMDYVFCFLLKHINKILNI